MQRTLTLTFWLALVACGDELNPQAAPAHAPYMPPSAAQVETREVDVIDEVWTCEGLRWTLQLAGPDLIFPCAEPCFRGMCAHGVFQRLVEGGEVRPFGCTGLRLLCTSCGGHPDCP